MIKGKNIKNNERVNKFKDLYYKNEKLRQQLKLLNVKLNQRLQKVKLMPSKKRKAMSVDLNVQKPSKALQRQLQNAYNQIAMYKKQIATLKIKQESESTYQKYKTLENQISYKDIEITKVQDQLKAIRNIKKIQDRTLVQDLENQDLKDKLKQYQRQFKQGQQKLKQIAKKARKRQQQYKKQQAYQVALQKKLRKGNQEQAEQDEILMGINNGKNVVPQQLTEIQFKQVKQQIQKWKGEYQTLQKKLDLHKKGIKALKKQKDQCEQKWKQRDVDLKGVHLKIQSYKRLIKDNQKKKLETQLKTNYNEMNVHKTEKQQSMMKLDENDFQSQDPEDEYDQQHPYIKNVNVPFEMSQVASTIKDQRQWKGKPRKITFGFMDSNDSIHKLSGSLKGLKIYTDDSKLICGLSYLYKDQNNMDKESGVIGSRGNTELKFELKSNDKLAKIEGSLTQQGYLSQLLLTTMSGQGMRLGNNGGVDHFSDKIEKGQEITGFSCGVRKLGQDTRITQLGFWLVKGQNQ